MNDKLKKQLEEWGIDLKTFLSILGGLALGRLTVSLVPSVQNEMLNKVLAGLVGSGIAIATTGFAKNKYVKYGAMGFGTAGVADIIAKLTEGSDNRIIQKINQAAALPEIDLSGLRGFGQVYAGEDMFLQGPADNVRMLPEYNPYGAGEQFAA